jgi:carbamate kinase
VLGAETEGMIGYLIEQALGNRLGGSSVATLLTQVVVAAADPAFGAPTKPIGPIYSEAEARRLAAERGWTVAADGTSFRRVVASPQPLDIVELRTIRLLLDAGVTVVCAGGGGVPVVADAAGHLHGVEAVIDKDLTAARLALLVEADQLVILTEVPRVQVQFGTAAARELTRLSVAEARELLAEGEFPEGSMGPKVRACVNFVSGGGRRAVIGSLAETREVVFGDAGTIFEADRSADG